MHSTTKGPPTDRNTGTRALRQPRRARKAELRTKPATFQRGLLASWLFALIRPQDAAGTTIGRATLELTTAAGRREIPIQDIRAISTVRQWLWGGVRIRTRRAEANVSGLNNRDAAAATRAVEETRTAWWRECLSEHAATVTALDARLAALEAPQCRLRPKAFRSLIEDVTRQAASLPDWWPGQVDAEPVAVAIKRIRTMLANADTALKRTNQIFEICRINKLLNELNEPKDYVRHRAFTALVRKARRTPRSLKKWYPGQAHPEPTVRALKRIQEFLADPEAVRRRANETFVKAELERSREFLDTVEARPLTHEQRRAVCVDDDRNLVVAAAGSGKTSVMVAKAGWTVERGDRQHGELLLLAFARNARGELKERIRRRLGARAADAMRIETFHSLGLAIIAEAEGRKPALARTAEDENALSDQLNDIVQELTDDAEYARAMIRWLAYRATPFRSQHEFKSFKEYWAYVQSYEIRSLQGEQVKSFEECVIANFLYLNGVRYEYERPYEHKTATPTKTQYKPDFYLLDEGIYIEHFALSEDGSPPEFIDQAKYTAARNWKLELHEKYGTTLIQTFSHEQKAGHLTEGLAEKLRRHGVALKPIPRQQIFAKLNEQGRVKALMQLTTTFLKHFKGSRLSMNALKDLATLRDATDRAAAFLRVFGPIFRRYETKLAQAGEIDFHDMINRAADHVTAGRYHSPFRYILVDEFQDISRGRAGLLKALLERSPTAQLFAVGDDWQAIYRFAGADTSVMREFNDHFGAGARTTLETTFRCADGVCEVATSFIRRNPAQIEKNVRPTNALAGPGVLVHPGSRKRDQALREALESIAADADASEGRSSLLLLGRYRHLEPQQLARLRCEYVGLNITYHTVHSAKGLEADYVVVIGIQAGRYGFPSEVTDDPLLNLVLGTPEEYPNAEERRLLYVALTRARRRAYLIEGGGPRSTFIGELLRTRKRIDTFGR